MKKVISFLLVLLVLLVPVIRRDSSSLAQAHYEISQDVIVLTQEFPTRSVAGEVFVDMTKIQAFDIQTRRGGFIRLETRTGSQECFSLKIFRVPDNESFNTVMPYINGLTCYKELNGTKGNDLQWLRPGKYIYVLQSKVQYLMDYQVEERAKMHAETRVIITGKTHGA